VATLEELQAIVDRRNSPGGSTGSAQLSGVTVDQLQSIVDQRKAAEVEQEPSALRGLQIGAQGVGRGLADLVGGIPDIINAPLNAITGNINRLAGTEIPQFASVSEGLANIAGGVTEAVTPLDIIEPSEMSTGERIAHGASRFGTSFGAGGLAPQAGRVAGVVDEATPILGRMLPARDAAPVATAIDDVAMGAGAGTFSTAVDEAIPEDASPTAKALADLAANVTGAAVGRGTVGAGRTAGAIGNAAVSRLTSGPHALADPVSGFAPTNSSLDKAAGVAQGAATDPRLAAEQIGARADAAAAQRAPVATSGIASDDEGLIALEQAFRVQNTGPFAASDRAVRTDAANQLHNITPDVAADLSRDELVQFGRQATDAAGDIVGQRRQTNQQRVLDAEANVDDVAARKEVEDRRQADIVAPVAARRGGEGAASEQLDRAVVDGTLKPLTKEKNDAFDAIDPDRSVELPNADKVKATAQALQADVDGLVPANLSLPGQLTQALANVADDAPLLVSDVQKLRPQLKKAQEDARRSGNFQLADNIGTMRKDINDGFEELAEFDPDTANAQRIFNDEFSPRFGEGKGKQLRDDLNRDDLSRTNTPASATASKFLFSGGGSREAASDLKKILKDSPSEAAGLQAAEDYLTSSLSRVVDGEGKANAAKVGAWMDNHSDVLNELPSVKEKFTSFRRALVANEGESHALSQQLRDAKGQLRDTKASAADTERAIKNDALSLLVDKEPGKAVADAFNSSDPEKAFKSIGEQLKDNPDAKTAWKATIVDFLEQKLGTSDVQATTRGANPGDKVNPVSWAKSHQFFKKNSHVLAAALDDPGDMRALREMHNKLQPMTNLALRATAKSDTAENIDKLLKPIELVARAKYGHLQAGGVMKSLRLGISTIPGLSEKEVVNRLLFRMQFEPELAKHLLNRPTAKAAVAKWDKKMKALILAASASREAAGEEQ